MSGLTALLVATLLTIGLLAAVPTIRWNRLRKPRLAGPRPSLPHADQATGASPSA